MGENHGMVRALSLSSLLLLAAGPAMAHGGHVESGFLHPLTGPDHLLAMIGTGMWAAFLAARRPVAVLLVPGAFLVMMGFGAAAGFAGIKLPFSEAGILASVFLIGALVVAAVRLPLVAAMLLVGGFAALHGYAHAIEAPAGNPAGYMLGFLTASALLQTVGVGLGWAAERLAGTFCFRTLGGLMMVGGALTLLPQ
jgi:urease accessory protein